MLREYGTFKPENLYTEENIKKYMTKNNIDWNMVAYENLSEQFIEQYKDRVNWNLISSRKQMTSNFIRKYKDKLDWSKVTLYQRVVNNETFYREFKDYIDWDITVHYNNFSNEFIREFKDKIHWIGVRGRRDFKDGEFLQNLK